MNTGHYKVIFSVEVFHSYFDDNICNCLHFTPAAETLKLLNRFGFRIRNHINGFEFYCNSDQSFLIFQEYISSSTGQTEFAFEIGSDNPAFTYFTDLPSDWMGRLIYNSSDPSNLFENGSVSLVTRLSQKETGSLTGNLSVKFDDIVKYTHEKGSASFKIRLHARSTQWQYFIVNKSSVQLANPFIKGTNNSIEFDLPQKVSIQSGDEALMFSSGRNFLPLAKRSKYRFSLVDQLLPSGTDAIQRSRDRIIFKGLPDPDPMRINVVNVNGSKHVSSPMYVFV